MVREIRTSKGITCYNNFITALLLSTDNKITCNGLLNCFKLQYRQIFHVAYLNTDNSNNINKFHCLGIK